MEQIERRGDSIYYGDIKCTSADDAYRLFRNELHHSIGRDSNKRLDRLGRRTDLIHWSGFVFENAPDENMYCVDVKSRILGISCSSYCRIIGLNDLPDISDEESDEFFDWLLTDGNSHLKLIGRKSGLGRTNRRNNINYKR